MEEDYKELGMEKEYMEDVVIYNLNKFIEYCNGPQNFEYDYDFKQHKEVAGDIENLIEGYRELEEKCQRYKECKDENNRKYIEVTSLYLNSVPKSKIKEKIEYIKARYIDTPDVQNIKGYTYNYYVGKVDVLQELMEDK